ncbi:MAG: DUF350 domain-containing protein [Candidatus Latescibacterota bacterium]
MLFLTSLGTFLLDVGIALIPFVIVLWIYKVIVQGRYRGSGLDLDRELGAAENPAVNLLMVGLLFGLVFAFRGVAFPEGVPLKDRILQLALYGAVVIALQLVAQVLTDKIILRRFNDAKQVFGEQNTSVALVKAAIAVATGQMVAAATGGNVHMLGQALIWFVVGQAVLVLLGVFYQWITPYDIQKELEEKNLAVGFGFSGMLIAGGIVVSRAVSGGATTEWSAELLSVGTFVLAIALVAVLMRFVFDWIVLPKVSFNEEIAEHRNVGAGLIEASAFILPAMYIVQVL